MFQYIKTFIRSPLNLLEQIGDISITLTVQKILRKSDIAIFDMLLILRLPCEITQHITL